MIIIWEQGAVANPWQWTGSVWNWAGTSGGDLVVTYPQILLTGNVQRNVAATGNAQRNVALTGDRGANAL